MYRCVVLDVYVAAILFHSVVSLFFQLIVSLAIQKLLSFKRSHLLVVGLNFWASESCPKALSHTYVHSACVIL